MTAEEIFAGESENVEFKSEIPAKSEKYMKTVVAFANGKGGKLVFGVENCHRLFQRGSLSEDGRDYQRHFR